MIADLRCTATRPPFDCATVCVFLDEALRIGWDWATSSQHPSWMRKKIKIWHQARAGVSSIATVLPPSQTRPVVRTWHDVRRIVAFFVRCFSDPATIRASCEGYPCGRLHRPRARRRRRSRGSIVSPAARRVGNQGLRRCGLRREGGMARVRRGCTGPCESTPAISSQRKRRRTPSRRYANSSPQDSRHRGGSLLTRLAISADSRLFRGVWLDGIRRCSVGSFM